MSAAPAKPLPAAAAPARRWQSARLWDRLAPHAEIRLSGGVLKLEWAGGTDPVWMTGPAEQVFEGSLEFPGEAQHSETSGSAK